jgi:hypothetical protein
MFLSDKNKSTRAKKAKPVRRQVLRNIEVPRSNQKQHIANQILRVTIPKSIFVGESDSEVVVKEEVSVRTFVTEPARVGAQMMWSAEEVKEVGKGKLESEWHGFRIYLEVPCYVERLVETQREVIEEVKREAEQQHREWTARSTLRMFGTEIDKSDLGLG